MQILSKTLNLNFCYFQTIHLPSSLMFLLIALLVAIEKINIENVIKNITKFF